MDTNEQQNQALDEQQKKVITILEKLDEVQKSVETDNEYTFLLALAAKMKMIIFESSHKQGIWHCLGVLHTMITDHSMPLFNEFIKEHKRREEEACQAKPNGEQ